MNISKKPFVWWTLGVNDIPGNIFANCLNNNGEDARKDMKLLSLMWVTNPHQDNSLQEAFDTDMSAFSGPRAAPKWKKIGVLKIVS